VIAKWSVSNYFSAFSTDKNYSSSLHVAAVQGRRLLRYMAWGRSWVWP